MIPDSISKGRSASLDVIRGVAILSVVAVHSFQQNIDLFPENLIPNSSRIFVGFSYLRFGVELFYLLSGWLIFSIYRSNTQEGGKTYFSKRATRIWPLWIVFSLVSFLFLITQWDASPVADRFIGDSAFQWIMGLMLVIFFLGWLTPELWNVPPGGWSIQVEVGHYALFWKFRKAKASTLLITVLVGYLTYFIAVAVRDSNSWPWLSDFAESWIRLGLYGTWPFFVAGGLALIWFTSRKTPSDPSNNVISGYNLLLGFLIATVLVTAIWIPIPFGMTYEAITVSLVLLFASWVFVKFRITLRFGVIFGKYSYFVYFAHFWILALVVPIIFNLVKILGMNDSVSFWVSFVASFAVTTTVSIAVAIPSWKYFESRWINRARQPDLEKG